MASKINPSDVEAATGMKVVAIDPKKKSTSRYVIAGGAVALVLIAIGVGALCFSVFRTEQGGSFDLTTTATTTSPPGTASDGCAYQGKIYDFGAKWRCCDGCNICTCEANGSVGMTEKACDPSKYQNTCKKVFALKSPPPPSPASSPPPSPSPSPAPSSPPPTASPSPDTNDEMDAPDPSVLEARDAWMSALFGDADSESAASSSLHVSVTDAPAVVAASDETMRKVEAKLNERVASQEEPTEQETAGKSLSNLGFAILEESTGDGAPATESGSGPSAAPAPAFKETRVNIDEDDALAASLADILQVTEAHTGAPKTPTDVDDLLGENTDSRRQLKVLGADGRAQVSCHNAHHHSFFKTVVAFHSKGSNWAYCSGTLIAPDVVLTAGHCIHDKHDGGWQWPDRVSIQSCSSSDATRTYKPKQMMTWTAWTTREDINYDIALVKLHSAPDYSKAGWLRPFYGYKHAGDLFGWKSFGWHNGMTNAWNFIVAGYPGDKQRAHGYSTMWWDYDRMCKASDNSACTGNPKQDFIRYRIDTAGGQSGSGVFHWGSANGVDYRIYAVHAYGWHNIANGGPRITRPKFLQMCAFISNRRVC